MELASLDAFASGSKKHYRSVANKQALGNIFSCCCSRDRFGETNARLWWEENKARIQQQYL
ncbi:hypothetical protein F2Q68_00017800 [Brassica cretica]|uniref:BRX domain-containing protein n=1 Tax=Brassica cretica TaxID=69181 RepID=A0A8S9HLF8_BRACR|nr:hypothetical protein F2Q68_00017800 [Brassica cretica]